MFWHLHDINLPIKTLRRNKLRSFLTSLGIIIGISSVIIIISVGAGAQSLVINQIKGMGSDLLGILPGGTLDSGQPAATMGVSITTLTYDDAKAIAKLPEIKAVSAYVRGVANITWQNRKSDTQFLGVPASYIEVENTQVIAGRFISSEEQDEVIRVVVLGSEIKDELFGTSDPINEKIRINKETFQVIGVMEPRGSAGFQNQDKQVFIPLVTAQKLMMGISHVAFIRAELAENVSPNVAIEEVKRLLHERHDIGKNGQDDFTIESADKAMDTLTSVTDSLNYFLAAIAALSLLVGGVGVMNIMLVAVSERTREIGLRKAVGAKRADISRQFLWETIILCTIGGISGIAIGVVISWLVSVVANYLGYDWDFVISPFSILLALVFTFLVAIIFGWYPAKKAANLQPVEALRYE